MCVCTEVERSPSVGSMKMMPAHHGSWGDRKLSQSSSHNSLICATNSATTDGCSATSGLRSGALSAIKTRFGEKPAQRHSTCVEGDEDALVSTDSLTTPSSGFGAERGSIICVLATDLPLAPGALERLARRAALGIARGGTPGGNSSGDIFLAFSTANPVDLPQIAGPWRSLTLLNDELLDTVYLAAVEAVDEAVLNAMLAAGDTPTARPSGSLCRGLDPDRLCAILRPLGLVQA